MGVLAANFLLFSPEKQDLKSPSTQRRQNCFSHEDGSAKKVQIVELDLDINAPFSISI